MSKKRNFHTLMKSSSSKGKLPLVSASQQSGAKSQTTVKFDAEPTSNLQIVYIHGIGEQDQPAILKRTFDLAMFGRDVAERARLVYWADILHPLEDPNESFAGPPPTLSAELATIFGESDSSKDAMAWAECLAKKMVEQSGTESRVAEWANTSNFDAKILPSSSFRRWLTRKITNAFVRDVAAYFYDDGVRDRIQSRFRSVVVPGGGPYLIVSHSLGTVIAYDVLSQLGQAVNVSLFVTLGSPLGIDEVQDNIEQPLKVPAGVRMWKNFADRLDPVALDRSLENDFAPRNFIQDNWVVNLHTRRLRGFNPHSSLGYLGHPDVQSVVHDFVPLESIARTRSFVIAKDLADDMVGSSDRIPVLIEVDHYGATIDLARQNIIQEISSLTKDTSTDLVELHELRRYVAANLTTYEISLLESRHKELSIFRLWRNSEKKTLMNVSTHCVQAYTAQMGYKATGKRIAWAVLDTGINQNHPHFAMHTNIVKMWDCTKSGTIVPGGEDGNGHGTHVSGIIAGREQNPPKNRDPYVGMAPETETENAILRSKLPKRITVTPEERRQLVKAGRTHIPTLFVTA